MNRKTLLLGTAAVGSAIVLVLATVFALESVAWASSDPGVVAVVGDEVVQWAFAAAAVSAGLSALAAGYAVAHVGSAAVGALAEKPELMGRALVLVGLAEGIAIYGLIVAILILNRVG
jgi:V/A-type H+-transporting ATPase subunit K